MVPKRKEAWSVNRAPSKSSQWCNLSVTPAEQTVKDRHYETEKNKAACFRIRSDDEPRYAGVASLDLPPGNYWVNVSVRVVKTGKRRGQHYFKVSLNPCDREGSAKS
jgi:hypothetical protein